MARRKGDGIPKDPLEIKEKVVQRSEGKPLPEKARVLADETGRQVSGDYERRQEEQAVTSPPKKTRPKRTTP
jgi:hypothetical protein